MGQLRSKFHDRNTEIAILTESKYRYRLLDEEEAAQFTDVYWIRFADISAARIAKRKCDDYNFIGNLLDVSYAPQLESVTDMKNKLEERRRIVSRKIAQSML